MYDYLKCACPRIYHRYWLENSGLQFHAPVNVQSENVFNNQDIVNTTTGEVQSRTYTAKEKNLEFKIIPSKLPGAYHCQLSGSLHKYANEGIHNGNNFYFDDFIQQVHHLRTTFDVNPAETEIQTFEYGVNIRLPEGITAGQFIDSVICMPKKRFSVMNINKVKVGKIARFTNHDLKIYDKPGQLSDHKKMDKTVPLPDGMVRIEIRVKKMRYLEQKALSLKKPHRNLTLLDLLQPEFARVMGEHLAHLFNEVIFYDSRLTIEAMQHLTHKQQLRLMQFQSFHYWENLDPKQRYRQRQKFAQLMQRCNLEPIHAQITEAISAKVTELLRSQKSKNGVCTHHELIDTEFHKMGINTPFKCRVHTSPPSLQKTKIPKPKKRYCQTCGRDITHQRAGSLYCSSTIYGAQGKACRNRATTIKRAKKANRQKLKEQTTLKTLLRTNKKINRITIYLNTGQQLRPTLATLLLMPWTTRRKIIKLVASGHTLTRSRAKYYVKYLLKKEFDL